MKVHVHRAPERMAYLIRAEVGEQTNGSRLFLTDDGGVVEVRPGEEAPLYCAPIPEEIVRALVDEVEHPPDATERHLYDAMEIRDRLLTMLEGREKPAQVVVVPMGTQIATSDDLLLPR